MGKTRESEPSLAAFPSLSPRWRAYAQLVRLPAVFTSSADICLGWCGALATGGSASTWPSFLALVAASAWLYSAGMVWNDFFDLEQDRRERPFRPIPSGRVPRRTAGILGAILFVVGLAFAALAGLGTGGFRWLPFNIGLILIPAILLY